MNQQVDLSVIIVNWNSAALLRQCLESLFSSLSDNYLSEVIVVDNASFDGSGEMVSKEFPGVRFIQSQVNLGFAGGNNLAFRQSNGAHVLFLNPDAEVVGNAIDTLLNVIKARRDVGIVGPKLVNPDLSVQIDCMRAFPTLFNLLVDSSAARRLLVRFNFAGVKSVMRENNGPVEVEMLPGTCIMLRRDVFDMAGGFNENYFMYAEDVELSYRVRTSGRRNYYVANAAVIHHGGKSSEQRSESHFSTVMIREAMYQFMTTTHGQIYGLIYRIATLTSSVVRLTLLTLSRVVPASHVFHLRADRSTRKWKKILSWSLGREGWARGYKPSSDVNRRAVIA